MEPDKNDEWLKEIAGEMREADLAHTPSFERVWRSAERRSVKRNRSWTVLAPKLALGCAAVLTVTAFVFWNSEEPKSHTTERDLAALDSVFVTYWEAPSDVLLEPLSSDLSGRVQ